MSNPRPIVNSNGGRFPSITEAARQMFLKTTGNLSAALKATALGYYATVAGLQWAYAEEKPEVWPPKLEKVQKASKAPKAPKPPKPEAPRAPVEQIDVSRWNAMFPPKFEGETWRPIPGLEGYEVSTKCYVRDVETTINLEDKWYRGNVSLVEIDGRRHKCVDLMLLAFIGPKPYGYVIQKRIGTSEKLSNVYYEPRKPRTSP